MLNKSTSHSDHVVQSGVAQYPIGFEFQYNGDDTPQIRVTIGAMVATENLHFVITEDLLNIKLIPLEEEAPEDPNDYSWLEKWVGMSLVIERDIPFVQESDYQVGRISPERIEKDFDLSVMRDQVLDDKIRAARDEFAEADKDLSDKIDETKAELQSGIDDKLPLSGGTLTGPLTINTNKAAGTTLTLKNESGKSYTFYVAETGVQMPFRIFSTQEIKPSGDGAYDLGDWLSKWKTVHATGLSNKVGEFIAVPEKSGTMACLDDIPETYTKEELDAKFAEIPDSADTYSKAEIDAKLSSVYKFKGSVANVNALPTGASVGDTYNVEDTGANYAWDGSKWDKLSDTIDLTGYATEEYVDDTAFALMDYIDDEVRPLKTDNKNLYNNQLVLRDMLNEKDENNEFIQLTTEAQTAIPAINELNEKKATKEDLAGYLPLSGGTVAGELSLEGVGTRPTHLTLKNTEHNRTCRLGVNYVGQLTFSFSGKSTDDFIFSPAGSIQSTSSISRDLGSVYYPWKRAYCEILNNGADLIVPTEGGTLARLEDIQNSGGGLSDKLGFNTDAGYLYFKDISNVDDFENLDAIALTSDVDGGALSIVNRYHGPLDQGELYRFSDDGFRAGEYTTGKKLGSDEVPWMTTYTAFISAGLGAGELELPTEGGTIARIEDIDERIGDISTALTAILGE